MQVKRNPQAVVLACSLWLASALPAHAQSYTFSTVAGSPVEYAYTDGTNTEARFNYPAGIAVAGTGEMYVADNAEIRKLVRSGSDWVVTTFPSNFVAGIAALALDAAGNLFVSDPFYNQIWEFTPSGTNWIGKVIAGSAPGFQDGTNTAAKFTGPNGIAVDPQGNVYVADTQNSRIRRISPVGTNRVTTTVAGSGAWSLIDGTNRGAAFQLPRGLALDGAGNLYVADTYNSSIRRIAPAGTNWVTTTIAGRLFAGTPGPASSDGTNRAAGFNLPFAIAVDSAGILYVADTYNNTIRKIVPVGTNWVTTTIGGVAGTNGIADGVGANAQFYEPYGIVVDKDGNLLVGDTHNYTIRFGTPGFALQTVTTEEGLVLSWPLAATNYVLQTSASLDPGAPWTPLSFGIAVQGENFVLTNRFEAPAAFFRLHR